MDKVKYDLVMVCIQLKGYVGNDDKVPVVLWDNRRYGTKYFECVVSGIMK
jgi:hypothetical protein